MVAFKELNCATGDELLGFLLPLARSIWSDQDESWIFRGQADADWELSPTACRKNAKAELLKYLGSDHERHEIPELEARVVDAFCTQLDRAGLEVPGDHPALRGHADGSSSGRRSMHEFPPRAKVWMFALAQHYGIPTRLLDWSYSPLVAAYFASLEPAMHIAGRVQLKSTSNRFAVWALSSYFVDTLTPPEIRLFMVPNRSNPNLHAQRGLFTLVSTGGAGLPPTILEVVLGIERQRPREFGRPVLYKLTAPHSDAARLLHKLRLQGVHRATLFPGHQAVADSLRERTLYEGGV